LSTRIPQLRPVAVTRAAARSLRQGLCRRRAGNQARLSDLSGAEAVGPAGEYEGVGSIPTFTAPTGDHPTVVIFLSDGHSSAAFTSALLKRIAIEALTAHLPVFHPLLAVAKINARVLGTDF
jgi:hypothetical protein